MSEEAVPWSILSTAKESAGVSPAYGWTTRGTRNDSGYGDMMTGYFISGKGPKLESDIPYYRGSESDPFGSYYDETPPENLSSTQNALEVTDIAYLDDASPEEIKEAIKAYGGVATSCNLSLHLYNAETAALWSPAFVESYANHAVCIVGWDDDYPKENFVAQEGELPQQDGAWLVKNSELADGEVAPYIWVSYEDGTILQESPNDHSYAIAGARPVTERTVYALDSDGAVSTVSAEPSDEGGEAVLSCANVYEFAEGERLTEAMFMTTSKGARYRIAYYPVDENLVPIADPSLAVTLAEGVVEHAGYMTVDLDYEVSIPADHGAIAIELTSSSGSVTLGVNENVDEYGNPLYTADAQSEIKSFYLADGSAEPAYSDPHAPTTFVLRVYGTENAEPVEPPEDPDEPSEDAGSPSDGSGDDAGDLGSGSNAPDAQTGQSGTGLARTGDTAAAAAAATTALLFGSLAAAAIRISGFRGHRTR